MVCAGEHIEAQFKQVASKQLVGSYLTVWVRASLLPHIKGVQVTHVATGFGGYLGNKGVVPFYHLFCDLPTMRLPCCSCWFGFAVRLGSQTC